MKQVTIRVSDGCDCGQVKPAKVEPG